MWNATSVGATENRIKMNTDIFPVAVEICWVQSTQVIHDGHRRPRPRELAAGNWRGQIHCTHIGKLPLSIPRGGRVEICIIVHPTAFHLENCMKMDQIW